MTSEKIMHVFDVLSGYLTEEESVVIPKAKLQEDVSDLTIAEIDAVVNTLQINEFIRLKYVDQDVYCIGILPVGIREKERREEERKEQERLRALEEERKRQEEEKKRLEEERAKAAAEGPTEGQEEETGEAVGDPDLTEQLPKKEKEEEYFSFSKKGVIRFMIALGLTVAFAMFLSIAAVAIAVSLKG